MAKESSDGPPRDIDKPGKIIVTGVPKDNVYSDADLEKEFSIFGRMTEAYIVRDRRTAKSRGFAFVTYENPQDAADAINAMEGKNLANSDRPLHCEQAFVGESKSRRSHEESFRGRGRGGPDGRGRGRGGDLRGRGGGPDRGGGRGGANRGWRGGRGGGGGGGMDFGDFRGEPYGGRGMRGRGDGMMRGRGRGRGEFHEPNAPRDGFYEHGGDGSYPDMHPPGGPPRGQPGRRTLLPNPGFRGGRGHGPPPPPHGPRGPPPPHMMERGANNYYEEGRDGYWNDGHRNNYGGGGEERGPHRGEGGYQDERFQEGDYRDPPAHPRRNSERMPPPPSRGGGRGPPPSPSHRGQGGRGPPHEGGRMPLREDADYPQREGMSGYPPPPSRRGAMAGGDYEGRGGAGAMRREAGNLEDYPPRRRPPVDEYGYPGEEGQDMRRQEVPRRPPPAQAYAEEDYNYEAHPRESEQYNGAPRRRGGRGGMAGRASPQQRRGPLLGHDPYNDDGSQGYYQGAQGQAADRYQDDGYSHPQEGQAGAQHCYPSGEEGQYGYDGMPAKAPGREEGYAPKRGPAGAGMYNDGYPTDAHEAPRRREGYDGGRPPAGTRRPEMEYPSRTDDYGTSDPYGAYPPRSRPARDTMEQVDPYGRKRPMEYEDDRRPPEMSEVRRDYPSERPGGMMAGPPASKRDRYEGFYQGRQEGGYGDF